MRRILIIVAGFNMILGLATSAQTELLAHYMLDEVSGTIVSDSGGNGYDASVNGSVIWVNGAIGNAFKFDGSTNITLPAGDIGLTSTEGSVSFWMRTNVTTGIHCMFWAGDNNTGGGYGPENEMHLNIEPFIPDVWEGGELSFFIMETTEVFIFSDPEKGTDPSAYPVNPVLMGDNQWHHVVATWGNSKARLYVDGIFLMESGYNSTNYDLTYMFLGQVASDKRYYTGKLDDVRLYAGPLSAQEIKDLYNAVDLPLICTETVIVYDTVHVTVYDTVTDALIIDVTISGLQSPDNKNTLTVYPNPTKDIVYINTGDNYLQMSNYTIKIISSTGSVIYNSNIDQQLIGIDIRTFGDTGLYFIEIHDEDNAIIDIRKLILE